MSFKSNEERGKAVIAAALERFYPALRHLQQMHDQAVECRDRGESEDAVAAAELGEVKAYEALRERMVQVDRARAWAVRLCRRPELN